MKYDDPKIGAVMVHCEGRSVEFGVSEWQEMHYPAGKYLALRVGPDVTIFLDERNVGYLRGVLSEAAAKLPQGGTEPGDLDTGDEQRDAGVALN